MRTNTTAVQHSRTIRPIPLNGATSFGAGKTIPFAYANLFREDSIRGQMTLNLQMAETVERLSTSTSMRVQAWVVPSVAMARFSASMDRFDKSYKKLPDIDGGSVTPYIFPMDFVWDGINEKLGIHADDNASTNSAIVESFNMIINHRFKNLSKNLTLRDLYDTTLPPCPWPLNRLSHIVPDYDQNMMDGAVPLEVVDSSLPVYGIGLAQVGSTPLSTEVDGAEESYSSWFSVNGSGNNNSAFDNLKVKTDTNGKPDIYAALTDGGLSLSTANLDAVRKSQQWAAIRQQYSGLSEDYLIDMLMDGLRIPNQAMRHPFKVADVSTLVGYNQRFASDGANLEKSVTTGQSIVDINFAIPSLPCGGLVIFTVEVVPEPLFERQKDHFVHTLDQDKYPSRLRDELDPEPIEIVTNADLDISHSDPTSLAGYQGLNRKWAKSIPRFGGHFAKRTPAAAWSEYRNSIWATDTADPTLNSGWYLANSLTEEVFASTATDNFELYYKGMGQAQGLTVLGPDVSESSDSFDAIQEDIPFDRNVLS
jgi:hypothetical protein